MKILTTLAIVLLTCLPAAAQRTHDPLTGREVDQLREAAQDPDRRIGLLLEYATERLVAVERLHKLEAPSDRDVETLASLLDDMATLVDELDDNLEMYDQHGEDLRHALRRVLAAEEDFRNRLAMLDHERTMLHRRAYAAALAVASESVQQSQESSRTMLESQIARKGVLKEKPTRPAAPRE